MVNLGDPWGTGFLLDSLEFDLLVCGKLLTKKIKNKISDDDCTTRSEGCSAFLTNLIHKNMDKISITMPRIQRTNSIFLPLISVR